MTQAVGFTSLISKFPELRLPLILNDATCDTPYMCSPPSCKEYGSSAALDSYVEDLSGSENKTKALKLAFRIKECSVMLSRLPPAMLQNLPVRLKQSSGRFKCIFADCPATVFMRKKDCENHIERSHPSVIATSKEDTDAETDGHPEFPCIFTDCDCSLGHFPDLASRNAHLHQAHGMAFEDVLLSVDNVKSNQKKIRVKARKIKKLNTNSFKCIFADCSENRSFDTEEARDSHLRDDHSLEESTMEACKNIEPSPSARYKSTSKSSSEMYQCTMKGCKNRKFYSSKELYDMHIKKAHEGITHPFVCDECGQKFRAHMELQIHVKTRHLGQYPFICQYCGKGFLSVAALNIHLPKHTNERNYKCDLCPEAFKTRSGLLYHTRSVHTGERPFRCDRCGKGFYSSVKLTNHIKCVHNREERPCICHVCGKGFPIRNYLYMHLRTHRDDVGSKSLKKSRTNEPSQALSAAEPQSDLQNVSSESFVTNNNNKRNSLDVSMVVETTDRSTTWLSLQPPTRTISDLQPETSVQQYFHVLQNPSSQNVNSAFTLHHSSYLHATLPVNPQNQRN